MFVRINEKNGKTRVINILQIVWFDANKCIICMTNDGRITVDEESMMRVIDITISINKRLMKMEG